MRRSITLTLTILMTFTLFACQVSLADEMPIEEQSSGAEILIPSLESFSNGAFHLDSKSMNESGCYELTYGSSIGYDGYDMALSYAFMLADYGFVYKNSVMMPSMEAMQMIINVYWDYPGEITHSEDKVCGVIFDVAVSIDKVFQNSDRDGTVVTLIYPKEVGLQAEETSETDQSYTVRAQDGRVLSAKPGFAQVLCTARYTSDVRAEATILLPSFEAFTSRNFRSDGEKLDDGYYETFFSADKRGSDFEDLVAAYIAQIEDCGFSLATTSGLRDGSFTNYYLNYQGQITHGAKSWDGVSYDICLTASGFFAGGGSVTLRYPQEVGISTNSAGNDYDVINMVATDSYINNDLLVFKLAGWGESGGDIVYVGFNPAAYSKGDIITLDNLLAQKKAGSNALCTADVWGEFITGEEIVGFISEDGFKDAQIEILENAGSTAAIHYYIVVLSGSSEYILEGVASTGAPSGQQSYSSGSNYNDDYSPLSGDKDDTCTMCSGRKTSRCGTCGGDGVIQCRNCGGTGRKYDFLSDTTTVCNGCNGHGENSCYNSQCSGGKVPCSFCNGTGHR